MRTPEDTKVIRAMLAYGGSFVQALSTACRFADTDNLQRIKTAFPEYWQQYTDLGKNIKEETNEDN